MRVLTSAHVLATVLTGKHSFVLLTPYDLRFGPYFTEPVIAGLDKNNKPYICAMDLLGAGLLTEDFVLAGTCSENLYGMCESLYRPNMVRGSAGWIASVISCLVDEHLLLAIIRAPHELIFPLFCRNPTICSRPFRKPYCLRLIATRSAVGVELFMSCTLLS